MYKRIFAFALVLAMCAPALAESPLPPEPADFTLAVALKTALVHNPDIQTAEARLEEAKLDKQTQDLWWARSINASANYLAGGYGAYGVTANGALVPSAAAGIGLNLGDLLNGPRQSARAAEEVRIAEADLRKTTLAVASQVTAAYEQYEAAKELSAMNPDMLQAADADLRVAERQFTLGNGAANLILGARLAAIRIHSESIQAKGNVTTAWGNLLSVMGGDQWPLQPEVQGGR